MKLHYSTFLAAGMMILTKQAHGQFSPRRLRAADFDQESSTMSMPSNAASAGEDSDVLLESPLATIEELPSIEVPYGDVPAVKPSDIGGGYSGGSHSLVDLFCKFMGHSSKFSQYCAPKTKVTVIGLGTGCSTGTGYAVEQGYRFVGNGCQGGDFYCMDGLVRDYVGDCEWETEFKDLSFATATDRSQAALAVRSGREFGDPAVLCNVKGSGKVAFRYNDGTTWTTVGAVTDPIVQSAIQKHLIDGKSMKLKMRRVGKQWSACFQLPDCAHAPSLKQWTDVPVACGVSTRLQVLERAQLVPGLIVRGDDGKHTSGDCTGFICREWESHEYL